MVNTIQSDATFENNIYTDNVVSDDMYSITGILLESTDNDKIGKRRNLTVVKSFGDVDDNISKFINENGLQSHPNTHSVNSTERVAKYLLNLCEDSDLGTSTVGVAKVRDYKHTCIFKKMPSNKLFLLCIEDNAIFEQTYLDLMKSGHYDTFLDRMA